METTEPRSTNGTEQPTPEALGGGRAVKKKRSFLRRTGLVLLWLLLIVLVLGFGVGLLTQLPVFRHFVVNQLEGTLENGTNGRLTVGDIQGNLLQGFVMSDVTLRLKRGTAYDTVPPIHADKVIAQYSLLYFLRTGEIRISSFVLQNPIIHVVRFAGDTNWNYELFAKAPAAKTPSKAFSQIIDLASLQIQNGSFYLRDYNFPSYQQDPAIRQKDVIDWNDVEVQGIDLETRFSLHGAASQSVHVSHLQFRETHSGLFVQRLGFTGYLDSSQARIDNAKIVTGHSDLAFSIKVSPPKIIETGLLTSIKNSLVEANVNGPVISTNELKQFLPKPLGFLGSSPGIDLVTTGEFGKLHIKKLTLDFKDRGSIAISGDLNNLQQPDSLTMDLDLRAKNLSNATLDAFVPGLHLPDLNRFGEINISKLIYTGAPLNFHTTFDATSSGAGNAAGDIRLDLRRKQMVYRASLKTTNFNLAALIHDPNYESSITAETQISGQGTNWKTMTSTIVLRTDAASTIDAYRANSLDLAGAIKKGAVTIDHLNADINDGPEVHIRSASAELTASTLPFRFDGSIHNFPLSKVLSGDSLNPARVDLDANIAGEANGFDSVLGTAHLRLFDLACQGYSLPDDTADITITTVRPGENKLLLQSSVADLTVDRNFKTGDLIHAIPEHINTLLTAIENRDFPSRENFPLRSRINKDSIDFDYSLQIKDLRSFADFFPNTFLLGQGEISGVVHGNANGDLTIAMNADSLGFIVRDRPSVDSVPSIKIDTVSQIHPTAHRDTAALALPKFGVGTPRIHLMPTSFFLTLQDLSNDPKTVLGQLQANLDLTTDSVIRLGSALLYHPECRLNYNNQILNFHTRSIYNNAVAIDLSGTTRFPNGDLDFTFDTVMLTYKNPFFTPTSNTLRDFVWENEGPARVILARNGTLTIDSLNIIHPLMNMENRRGEEAQHMRIGGTLSGDTVNAWATFPSFQIEELTRILPFNPNSGAFDFTKYTGTVRDFHVTLSGTLEQPDVTAKLFADSIKYEGEEENTITFDSNYVDLEYHDQVLRGILDLHVAKVTSNQPSTINPVSLKGSELRATIDSIPLVFALKRGPTFAADSARAAMRPLSASIRADQFPLDVATPFLPPFRQIVGSGDINFNITGTRNNIEYAGTASIQRGELLLAATNMWYLFGGSLAFTHNNLVLQNDSIHNIAADDSLGAAVLNGTFTFNGFNITNFDLRLRSDRLMVLSDAAKASLPVAYGPVTINTGGQDFKFYNTFDKPKIYGTINIMSANVTMPESDNSEQSISSEGVIYEILPTDSIWTVLPMDTLQTITGQNYAASIQLSRFDDTLFPNWMKNIYLNDDGSMGQVVITSGEAPTQQTDALAPSFTDKLQMNLLINTEGTAAITIPFGGLVIIGSQLRGELKSGGTLQIDRGDDLQTRAIGEFDLSPNSTFTFIQNFTIPHGNIKFIGDFSNPSLDVNAEYIGQHQGTSEQAKIALHVTGTKNYPIIMWTNSQQPTPGGEFVTRQEQSPAEAQQDALYFLGTGGYFKNDLGANSGSAYSKMLPALGGQAFANVLTNLAGSTSSQFAIRSASLSLGNYGGAQVTAAIRDITIKLGESNNATGQYGGLNFVTDIPLSYLSSVDVLRNAFVEIQYNPNPTITNASALTQQTIFLSKLVYTIKW
jgi:hypothetical protein